jgi:hypothetical protein
MKAFKSALLLLSVVAFLPASAADAQFDAFWVKFKLALKTNDKAAIASMTKLPYTIADKPLNKAAYIAQIDSVFTSKVRKCLQKGKPIFDHESYMAFCGEEIFVFEKVKGQWMFTEIGAND